MEYIQIAQRRLNEMNYIQEIFDVKSVHIYRENIFTPLKDVRILHILTF